MLRGLTTVSFYAEDVQSATAWYSEFLGIEPYFVRPVEGPPAYVEFRVGDYQHELGIIDKRYAPAGTQTRPDGAVIYWHVDDIQAAMSKLKAMGATEYESITPRESNFITASVVDPFGNVLGIMQNPHYLSILDSLK